MEIQHWGTDRRLRKEEQTCFMESFQTLLKEVHLEKLTCLCFRANSYKIRQQVIMSILLKRHQQNLMQLFCFATGFF